MNLRTDAEGRTCQIRVPGVCREQPTCLCHLRLIGISGAGYKAADLLGAFGCGPCHDIVDNRVPSRYTYAERRALLLEGMARTQVQWVERGVVSW